MEKADGWDWRRGRDGEEKRKVVDEGRWKNWALMYRARTRVSEEKEMASKSHKKRLVSLHIPHDSRRSCPHIPAPLVAEQPSAST